MRRPEPFVLAAFLLLSGCNEAKKPNAAHLTVAINRYLAKHGAECTFFAQAFPIDVPASELKDQSGTAPQMAALESSDLVRGNDTTAVIQGMIGALGPSAPRPVRRYQLTDEGRKYFQVKPGGLGQSSALCYGHEVVDSIVSWTKPESMGSVLETEVTYTYKMPDLAPWATRADVQQAFGDIRTTVGGISRTEETAELQLTNVGWEVDGQ
ncbi:MAG TPA: hypothetical protein VKX41_08310 [Alloacidobacterium sp.]|jgi:hypothetical protein|nr:hypothetical protein [Alloacidobacterium sp.]